MASNGNSRGNNVGDTSESQNASSRRVARHASPAFSRESDGSDRREISAFERDFYLRHRASLESTKAISGVLPAIPHNSDFDQIIVWVSAAYRGPGRFFELIPMAVLELVSREMERDLLLATFEQPLPNHMRIRAYKVDRRSKLPIARYASIMHPFALVCTCEYQVNN